MAILEEVDDAAPNYYQVGFLLTSLGVLVIYVSVIYVSVIYVSVIYVSVI
jgi:hypothetical protein